MPASWLVTSPPSPIKPSAKNTVSQVKRLSHCPPAFGGSFVVSSPINFKNGASFQNVQFFDAAITFSFGKTCNMAGLLTFPAAKGRV
jgi:hypothetical protein